MIREAGIPKRNTLDHVYGFLKILNRRADLIRIFYYHQTRIFKIWILLASEFIFHQINFIKKCVQNPLASEFIDN